MSYETSGLTFNFKIIGVNRTIQYSSKILLLHFVFLKRKGEFISMKKNTTIVQKRFEVDIFHNHINVSID